MDKILPYLGDVSHLTDVSSIPGGEYVHPRLKNLGSVSFVLIREIVAPTVFRNSESEITDIDLAIAGGEQVVRTVRAVPNKFKHKERSRGLQILRAFGAGGKFPQNRSVVGDGTEIGEIFDLNSLVFGDSVNHGNRVLPVKAATLYSDGIGLSEYHESVGKTFHNRAAEDGTLFDAAKKENSNNLFDRHFILPGTLLVQTISTHGRLLPREGLDHLLLSLGSAGAYGGQTSVTGVNVRSHIVGIYASKVERAETSPFEIAGHIVGKGGVGSVMEAIRAIDAYVAPAHEVVVPHAEATAYQDALVKRLTDGDESLASQYASTAKEVAALFTAWFSGKAKGGKKES